MTDSRLTKEQTLDLDTFAGVDYPSPPARPLVIATAGVCSSNRPRTLKAELARRPRRYFCAGYVYRQFGDADRVVYRA